MLVFSGRCISSVMFQFRFFDLGKLLSPRWRGLKQAMKYKTGDKLSLKRSNLLIKQSLIVVRDFLDSFNSTSRTLGSIASLKVFCQDGVFKALAGARTCDIILAGLAGVSRHSRTLAVSSFYTVCQWKAKKAYSSNNGQGTSKSQEWSATKFWRFARGNLFCFLM